MGYPTKIQLISRQKGNQWYVVFMHSISPHPNLGKSPVTKQKKASPEELANKKQSENNKAQNPELTRTFSIKVESTTSKFSKAAL